MKINDLIHVKYYMICENKRNRKIPSVMIYNMENK